MIILIIYLIGVIIAYMITRWANRKYHNCTKNPCKDKFCDRHYTWKIVFSNFLMGLFSWIGVIIFLVIQITYNMETKEPPKFL